MITTYAIYDNAGRDVCGYFNYLSEARHFALPGNYIVTLKGPEKFEGFHRVVRKVISRTGYKLKCKYVNKLGE